MGAPRSGAWWILVPAMPADVGGLRLLLSHACDHSLLADRHCCDTDVQAMCQPGAPAAALLTLTGSCPLPPFTPGSGPAAHMHCRGVVIGGHHGDGLSLVILCAQCAQRDCLAGALGPCVDSHLWMC